MSEETTFNSDNGAADNSEAYSDADIASALGYDEEPETNDEDGDKPQEDAPEVQDDKKEDAQPEDNTQIEYPDKFKKEDGTPDVERMFKSYSELESYKTKLEQERADLNKQIEEMNQQREQQARDAGFNSVEDMQYVYGVASFEANEYAKYLAYTDDPEAVRSMLINYQNNPSPKLMEEIEMEFSPDINKKVATASAKAQALYEQNLAQQRQTDKLSNIESIISKTVDANSDVFEYEPFKKMFVSLLQKYGDAIEPDDAILLANTVSQIKDLYKQEFEKATGKQIANDDATNKLAALSNTKTAPASSQNVNWEGLSQGELEKEIAKLI